MKQSHLFKIIRSDLLTMDICVYIGLSEDYIERRCDIEVKVNGLDWLIGEKTKCNCDEPKDDHVHIRMGH